MRKTCRVVVAAMPITWAAMAFGARPSAEPAPVGVVEAQMQVFAGGITYEEYLDRQAALHVELVNEIPAEAMRAQVVVQLTPVQINSLFEPVSTTPLQIGVVAPIAPNVQIVGLDRAQGTAQLGAGLVWALPIASPDAGAIRIHLENVSLPPGSELYFYSRDGQAFGPYAGTGPHGTGEFWTETIFGSEAILQLRAPQADNATLQQITFNVTELGHIGSQFTDGVQAARTGDFCGNGNPPCVEEASCYAGANATENAIAKMEWIAGQFIYTCTTGLLTDNNPTQNNFALTANHCVSSNSTAANINFYWRFATATCGGACPSNSGWPFLTSGATVSATGSGGSGGDFTLLHLNSNPPSGSVFMGWTNSAVAFTNGAALHRVSNPNFGPQVYSEHSVDTSAGTCNGFPRGNIIYSRDTLGAQDGGSSGSPVVNASNQVVGQLYGACGSNPGDACANGPGEANATIDGAFAHYWPSVCPHLDPSNCGGGGCSPAGASCTSNSQCCSNNCKGKPGNKTCK